MTDRQQSIVKLIAEGRSNKQAAAVLNLSIKTIETHRVAIMRKLGLTSMAGVVRRREP